MHSHDITALIRDTEVHERALFTPKQTNQPAVRRSTVSGLDVSRRSLIEDSTSTHFSRLGSPMVARLGGEIEKEIRKRQANGGKEQGELDVTILLEGAEKLCGI